MVICHIMCEFCIVDVKLIVFVSDESLVEGMLRSIVFECIEFVLNLNVGILVLALGLATLGLNNPDSSTFLHNYIVSIEEPLILKPIPIYDGEVLLTGVSVLIDPFNIITAFAEFLMYYEQGLWYIRKYNHGMHWSGIPLHSLHPGRTYRSPAPEYGRLTSSN